MLLRQDNNGRYRHDRDLIGHITARAEPLLGLRPSNNSSIKMLDANHRHRVTDIRLDRHDSFHAVFEQRRSRLSLYETRNLQSSDKLNARRPKTQIRAAFISDGGLPEWKDGAVTFV